MGSNILFHGFNCTDLAAVVNQNTQTAGVCQPSQVGTPVYSLIGKKLIPIGLSDLILSLLVVLFLLQSTNICVHIMLLYLFIYFFSLWLIPLCTCVYRLTGHEMLWSKNVSIQRGKSQSKRMHHTNNILFFMVGFKVFQERMSLHLQIISSK